MPSEPFAGKAGVGTMVLAQPVMTMVRRFFVTLLALVMVGVLWGAIAPPTQAALLYRTLNDQEICILSVKRSAKNYWEYRAAVSVEGQERPVEVYDCRARVRIRRDGTSVPFEQGGAGELICRLLN